MAANALPTLERTSWNVADFNGYYHVHKMKSKPPVPGTQIKVEQEKILKFDKWYVFRHVVTCTNTVTLSPSL